MKYGADEAAAAVRSWCRCRVLGVTSDFDGAPVWRVKVLLSGGRVRIVRVDARSGRILD